MPFDDPWRLFGMVLYNAAIHSLARWWFKNTATGMLAFDFLTTWRTDSFLHLCLCAGTVFIYGLCAIFGLALLLQAVGL